MSIEVYRIAKSKYASEFLSGEGPYKFGGRWNSTGTRLIYTSESLALAMLEIVVHFDAEQVRKQYSYATVKIEESHVLPVEDFAALPKTWRDSPSPLVIQEIGDAWVQSGASLALKVPTAILPIGFNYLINVNHADFVKVESTEPKPLSVDGRLFN